MKIWDIFRLSTRMFRTRPTRTWLTILGISVGISTVVFLVSLGYGLQKIILERIVFSQALLSLTVTPSSGLLSLTDERIDALAHLPHARDVAPLAAFSGQITLDQLNGSVEIRAVDPAYFGYGGITPISGALYTSEQLQSVVVSEAVLRLFGAQNNNNFIGKQLTLRVLSNGVNEKESEQTATVLPHTYTIIGIVEDHQESYIYVPLKDIKNDLSIARYEHVQIQVDNGKNLAATKETILSMGYQVQSLQETIDQANKIFRVFQIILSLFGAVALVVSAIGMFNTMTVTLLERTNEIGIMRALGAGKGAIRSLFLSESVILGLLGGVLGLVIGMGTGKIFNVIINNLAVRFGGSAATLFYYPHWFLGLVVMLSVIIGFFSGIFPSYRAAKMDPLEALHYK